MFDTQVTTTVRTDGKLFRALAGVMGLNEPDAYAIVWPGDPRYYGPDGVNPDPDGVYQVIEDQPELGTCRVIDLGEPQTVALALQIL